VTCVEECGEDRWVVVVVVVVSECTLWYTGGGGGGGRPCLSAWSRVVRPARHASGIEISDLHRWGPVPSPSVFYNPAAPHRAIDFDRLPYLSKAKQPVSFALLCCCCCCCVSKATPPLSTTAGLPTTKPPTPRFFAHAKGEVRWVGLGCVSVRFELALLAAAGDLCCWRRCRHDSPRARASWRPKTPTNHFPGNPAETTIRRARRKSSFIYSTCYGHALGCHFQHSTRQRR
jgi:hypothetical protein